MGFVVHARLGRGRVVETFSATLHVHQERLGVVVKRLRPSYAKDAALARALAAWGEAQTDVDHPNIVAVFEAGQTKDGAYVIQERVDGVPLSSLFKVLRKKRRTLHHHFALLIATRLAAALDYLSQRGRTGHGSLDAGEVMLAYNGDLKVGDQGLHRLAGIAGRDSRDEVDIADVYRAPEGVLEEANVPRADVYALGLLVLEMMIGHPVWATESMSVSDAIDAVSDFTHIGQASPGLTRDLLEILRPCLEHDPALRPATAGRVHQSFVELLQMYGIRPSEAALGRFVHAVLPPAEDGEAPTMMVDPAEAERLLERRRRPADWDAASVMINPEIEARARSAFDEEEGSPGAVPLSDEPESPDGRPYGDSSSRPDPRTDPAIVPPMAPPPRSARSLIGAPESSSRSAAPRSNDSVELVAEAVDMYAASPASLRKAAAGAGRGASPQPDRSASPGPQRPSARTEPPQAPSVLRDLAERVPNVSEVASAAYQNSSWGRSRILLGLVVAVFAMAAGFMFVVGDDASRTMPTVRLRVSSEPNNARLWVDGTLIGQTPVDVPVPQKSEPYRLRFGLPGYRTHEVTIGSTEKELRYEAVLRRSD